MFYKNEYDMYDKIAEHYRNLLTAFGYDVKVFETYKSIDEEIRSHFISEWEMLGRSYIPDLIIKISKNGIEDFFVIEVKKGAITIKDIAQAKMYGDILKPKYLLLIGGDLPRRKWVDYYNINNQFLRYNTNKYLRIAKMDTVNFHDSRMIPGGITFD
jgi:hypothetical protein